MTFELLSTRMSDGERREGRSRIVRSVISFVARRRRRRRAESRGCTGEVAIRSCGMLIDSRFSRADRVIGI